MSEAVIVEAVRTPISRGKPIVGDLHGFHEVFLVFSASSLSLSSGVAPPGSPRLPGTEKKREWLFIITQGVGRRPG